MRDNTKVRERFELNLEGRQVAALVAGALVVAGAIFALGLNVGRQLALRAAAAAPRPEAALPVAAPRPAPEPREAREKEPRLSYHDALTGKGGDPAIVEPKAEARGAPAGTGTALNALPPPPPAPPEKAPEKAADKGGEKAVEKGGAKPAAGAEKAPAKAESRPEPKAAAKPEARAAAKPPPKPAAKADPMASAVAKVSSLPPPAHAGRFAVQVGAAQTEAEAQKIRKRHAADGAAVVAADLPGKGRWYRVQIGAFATRAEAEKRLAALQAKGVRGFVAENR